MADTEFEQPADIARRWWHALMAVASAIVLLMAGVGFARAGDADAVANAPARLQLIMFEQAHCEWCARWDEEVGIVYAKTPEGRAAPLRRVDIRKRRPEDLRRLKAVRYTPTFVLVADGREVGRITGYASEDFFWGQFSQILKADGLSCRVRKDCAGDENAIGKLP